MNPLAIEILVVDDDALRTVTVADVLRNPDAFIGETLTDPLEGPSYGPCISCRICSSLRMGFQSNKDGHMGACAVFIDGGYAEKVFSSEYNAFKIDYGRLAKNMTGDDRLLRAYYYHCLPYQGNPPTRQEKERYEKMRKFVDALKFLPRFEVRLGQLAIVRTGADRKPVFQQKRVDLMLGVDMARLAGKGKIRSIALFTGDSDCIPAVEAVKQEGVIVTLWHGAIKGRHSPSRELFQLCDERRDIAEIIPVSLLEERNRRARISN
jgi:uncharacterized LabA/DUF88 family protein